MISELINSVSKMKSYCYLHGASANDMYQALFYSTTSALNSQEKKRIHVVATMRKLLSIFNDFQIDETSMEALVATVINEFTRDMMIPFIRLKNKSLPRRLRAHQAIRKAVLDFDAMLVHNGCQERKIQVFLLWTPPKHSKFQPIELLWARAKSSFSRIVMDKQCCRKPLLYMHAVFDCIMKAATQI